MEEQWVIRVKKAVSGQTNLLAMEIPEILTKLLQMATRESIKSVKDRWRMIIFPPERRRNLRSNTKMMSPFSKRMANSSICPNNSVLPYFSTQWACIVHCSDIVRFLVMSILLAVLILFFSRKYIILVTPLWSCDLKWQKQILFKYINLNDNKNVFKKRPLMITM